MRNENFALFEYKKSIKKLPMIIKTIDFKNQVILPRLGYQAENSFKEPKTHQEKK